jgi:hypothetical protein
MNLVYKLYNRYSYTLPANIKVKYIFVHNAYSVTSVEIEMPFTGI